MDNYIKEVIEKLNDASAKYYNTGTSPLSDAEYDKLYDELCQYEAQFGIVYSNSPTNKVGAPVLESVEKVKIEGKPMLSLEKVHTNEEIAEWAKGYPIVGSVKADGLSCRLIYENGWLKSANSRGNGVEGQDVTEHVKQFKNVPLVISKPGRYVIDGEAVIKYDDFAIINKDGQFANPRNTAAGTLNLLDMSIVKERRLSFIAWDVIEGGDYLTYKENLLQAINLGFNTIPIGNNNEEVMQLAQKYEIPCDGVVWRINNLEYGESLGKTDKFFKNAVAYKFEDEKYNTELLGIDWEVGRTGVLTPVAYFNKVDTGDSIVEKCSLHNLSIMKNLFGTLTPSVGTQITIVKSNQIIPMCIATGEIGNGADIELPTVCPYCGEKLIIKDDTDSQKLYCPNENCTCRLLNQLTHYVSKTAMNIKGLSKQTLNKLMNWYWISSIKDIYTLKDFRQSWITEEGFGPKSVDNILTAIEESKHCKLEQFITAIGIPLVGSKIAKDLAKTFGTWEEFLFAMEDGFKFYSLPNFGYEMDKAIKTFDYTEANYIATHYLTFESAEAESATTTLEGRTLVITGKLSLPRADIVKMIEAAGGKVASSVSRRTTCLVNNDPDSTSSKNVKAKQLGVPIISEEELYRLIGETN